MVKPDYSKLTANQLNGFWDFYQFLNITVFQFIYRVIFRTHIWGREHVPKDGSNYILACNHMSMHDPLALSLLTWYHPICYMAKKELFEKPILGPYLYSLRTFSVNREKMEMSTMKTAITVLKTRRWLLGLFPEGTRKGGEPISGIKRGVAYLAKAGQVPVLPAAIQREGKHFYIVAGEPIPWQDDLEAMTRTIEETMDRLLQECRAKAAAHSGR